MAPRRASGAASLFVLAAGASPARPRGCSSPLALRPFLPPGVDDALVAALDAPRQPVIERGARHPPRLPGAPAEVGHHRLRGVGRDALPLAGRPGAVAHPGERRQELRRLLRRAHPVVGLHRALPGGLGAALAGHLAVPLSAWSMAPTAIPPGAGKCD